MDMREKLGQVGMRILITCVLLRLAVLAVGGATPRMSITGRLHAPEPCCDLLRALKRSANPLTALLLAGPPDAFIAEIRRPEIDVEKEDEGKNVELNGAELIGGESGALQRFLPPESRRGG